MKFRHPSKERLRDWLFSADGDDPKLEEHIDDCERCSAVILALGDAGGEDSVAAALSRVLAAPPDLPVRLEAQVSERISGREFLGLMAELFGAGVETSRLLIVDPPPPDI